MNSRKSAKAIPSTLNRFLKSRALLKSPPPSFYPLLAHPPPPSLVRSFPARDEQDLHPNSPTRSVLAATKEQALNAGLRLQPHQLLSASPLQSPVARTTRRKPPQKLNPKHARPERIVFAEDSIRKRFYLDHPFEAYRPVDLVETDQVGGGGASTSTVQGEAWTELRQKSLNPSPEDCISFISNLVASHNLPRSTAYSHGITQYRTLRSEFETATLSARLEAQSHGAVFFGEIERAVMVEEKVLDQWVRAKEIQDGYAVSGGQRGGAQQPVQQQQAVPSEWSPVEGRPAQLGGGLGQEGEAVFTGGVEYLKQFRQSQGGAVSQGPGSLVGTSE